MPKVLITGGLGFIGSSLVRTCLKKGYEVRILDNEFRSKKNNLEDVLPEIEWIRGDATNSDTALEACQKVDWVFHLAAINGTRFFYEIPHKVLEVNVKGLITVLEAAQQKRCKKFLFASTSELYATPERIPTPEDERILIPDVKNPRFSYSGSKAVGELFCLHQDPKNKIHTVIIRYHNVYGPNMGEEHVIPQIFNKICEAASNFSLKKATIQIQGEGTETRAFCYIQDAVNATALAMEKGCDKNIYHIGTQEEVPIRELTQKMAKILNVDLEVLSGPLMPGSTPRRCPDISKMKELGYQPSISLDKGLSETLLWYLKQKGLSRSHA